MKKRFTEEQIISVLKDADARARVADLCRKHGISEATFYNRKVNPVSEAPSLPNFWPPDLGRVTNTARFQVTNGARVLQRRRHMQMANR